MAAVILETVVGTNGIIPPPAGTCDPQGLRPSRDPLLILDEVMAGFGRTGRWFACEHWDVVPDILTVAKGINSGYVPLGAMVARGEIVDKMRGQFFNGLTYAGHPLACASTIASIEAFQEEGIVEDAASVGAYLGESLRSSRTAPVDRRRAGAQVLLGVELVRNRDTKEMLVPFNASARPRPRSPSPSGARPGSLSP